MAVRRLLLPLHRGEPPHRGTYPYPTHPTPYPYPQRVTLPLALHPAPYPSWPLTPPTTRCASSSTLESSTTEGQLTRAVLRASLDSLAEAAA